MAFIRGTAAMEATFSRIILQLLSFVVIGALAGMIIPSDDYRYVDRTWPKLRGKPLDEAAMGILNDYPNLRLVVRSAKYGITPSMLLSTVFLYLDDNGRVINMPETSEIVRVELKIWPEAVGLRAGEARSLILREKTDAEIIILPRGSPVTLDHKVDRVRVFVNSSNVVVEAPQTG